MKVLLIHQFFLDSDEGGGSRFNEFVRLWGEKDQGIDVDILAGMMHYTGSEKKNEYKGQFIVQKKYLNRFNLYRCYTSEGYNKSFLGRLWGYFSFVFSALYCGFKIRKKGFDLVVCSSPPLFVGITAILLSWLYRCPFIFEVRDLWPESAIDTGVVKNKALIWAAYRLEAISYRLAKKIVVLTPAFKEKLITDKNVSADKIIEIPNGCDFDISEQILKRETTKNIRREKGWENKTVGIYVGAHGVANALHQILEAAEKAKNTEGALHFVLVGSGMKKAELVEIKKEKLLDNVEFIDPVPKDKVFELISAADFGISALAKNDTFKTIYSNKTFDYMACKKPILMAIDGISRDLIEQVDCGLFAEPENPSAIYANAQWFDKNKQGACEMGEKGYRYSIKHFSRESLAQKYMDCFSQIT